MSKQTIIAELKNLIAQNQTGAKPKFSVSFEYEAAGTFFYSAFTQKGFETHRYSVRIWTDSEGAIIGKCDCSNHFRCAHLRSAVKQYRGH